jgi:hypothetical protein
MHTINFFLAVWTLFGTAVCSCMYAREMVRARARARRR